MKMKDKDLKKSYQFFLATKKVNNGDCPQIDEIVNSLLDESLENKKLYILDHISGCPACLEKLKAIKPFLDESKRIKKKLKISSLSEKDMQALSQKAREKIAKLQECPKKTRNFAFWPKVKLVQFAVMAGLLIVVLGVLIMIKGPEGAKTDILRGKGDKMFHLISPIGVVAEGPIIFKWTPIPQAQAYEVRLMDEELTKIWVSMKTDKTKIPLPADIVGIIKKEKRYYWKVLFYMEPGNMKESGLQKFIIKKN